MDPRAGVRVVASEELRPEELAGLRAMLEESWVGEEDAFTDDDWTNALGGTHFLIEGRDGFLSHGAVVERELHADGRPLRTGYVEAIATAPRHRGRGHATAVMRSVGEHIDGSFELGALDTGIPPFYERLGWALWEGPTFVRTPSGLVRTPDEDGAVMVRFTPTSPRIDLAGPISCEWRPGDVW